MVWAGPVRDGINRRASIMGRGPFLQFGFGMTRSRNLASDRGLPVAADEGFGRFQPLIKEKRANQGLHNIPQHIVAVKGPVFKRLLTKLHTR